MVKHKKMIIMILLLVLATIPLWPKRRDVPFRMVASFDSGSNFRGDDNMPPPYSSVWYCVTTHPTSELSTKVFAEWYPMIDFNFEEYNYISVHGYTLEKLWYWEIPWIKGDSVTRHRGFVELASQGSPRETAVYEIPKVCIQSPGVSRDLSYYTRIVP